MDNGLEYWKHWTRLDKEKDKELNQLTRITQEQVHTTQTNVKTSKTQSLNEAQIEIEINC